MSGAEWRSVPKTDQVGMTARDRLAADIYKQWLGSATGLDKATEEQVKMLYGYAAKHAFMAADAFIAAR